MKKTWLICLVLASFVCGCQSKKESNAVLFEKFLDKNVASFAKVMAESGVDTIQAKKYCRCVFTQLYGIDSTFFKLPNDSINSLIDKYNPQNEMFRLLGTKRSFSQNETFFFSHPYPALFRLISHF